MSGPRLLTSDERQDLHRDGWEHGHRLTELLLPRLKASAPSRIAVVSSGIHTSGRIDFDDLALEKRWSGSYPRSKLATGSLFAPSRSVSRAPASS